MAYFEKVSLILKMVDGATVTFPGLAWQKGRWEVDGHVLEVACTRTLDFKVSRTDGKEMDLATVDFDFDLPLKNFNRFIVPDCGRYFDRYFLPLLSWGRTIANTGGNHGNPFAAFLNHHDEVILAVGAVGKMLEVGFTVTSPGRSVRNTLVVVDGRFRFQLTRPAGKFHWGKVKVLEESLFVTEGDKSWFHALRKYADAYYARFGSKFEVLEEAFFPTWCSWVPWNSDDLSEDKILSNARLAKEVGLKTIILDDGWYGPGCDSASLASNMGDYRPDPGKFQDLKGMAGKIRGLGLKSLLWVAPLAVSPEADCFKAHKHLLMMEKDKFWRSPSGFHDLCPCSPEARKVILEKIPDLLKYDFDGLKVDLYNNIGADPCTSKEHSHDCKTTTEGVMVLMKDYWKRLKELKPDCIMESKNNYANVYSSQFGSMTRGGDSPYDINNNFWNCVYPRAYCPVVHNDYLCWTPSEEDKDLAILLIKQITAGVPTISVDLAALPKNQLEILKGWIGLYNDHLDTLVKGSLEPQTGAMDVWMNHSKDKAIISLLHDAKEFDVPEGKTEVLVLNATDNPMLYVRTPGGRTLNATRTIFDHTMKNLGSSAQMLSDHGTITVPPAGIAILRIS